MSRKAKVALLASAVILGALAIGCSEKSNFDQRAVVFVSSVNGDKPFMCDVLNQGDSLYEHDRVTFKTSDDYVTEDVIAVVVHNKPYNSIIDPEKGALGNVLVTGYDVVFTPIGGSPVPVPPFSGRTSVLVPSGQDVTVSILICPFADKTIAPLVGLEYSPNEILSFAHVVFHAEEVQTSRTFTFEADFTVNFADPLNSKDNKNTP
jgi:hypothetical protein